MSLLGINDKIVLAKGVSIFNSEDETLLLKHSNKIYKISSVSELRKQSNIFHMLKRPKKLREILGSMSGFKEKDVLVILDTLLNLNLIEIQKSIGKHSSKITFHSIDSVQNQRRKNQQFGRDMRIVLIGSGVLAAKLAKYLKKADIKFKKINSISELGRRTKSVKSKTSDKKNKMVFQLTDSTMPLISSIKNSDLVLLAQDYPNITLFETVNRICFKENKAWLRVSFDDNLGYLGPLVVPGKSSCFNCCELRLITNAPYYEYELWRNKQYIPKTKLSAPEIFAEYLSTLCIKELQKFFTNYNESESINTLFILDTHQMFLTKHKILMHPNCIYCHQSSKEVAPEIFLKRSTRTSGKTLSPLLNDSKNSKLLSDAELLKRLRGIIDDRTGIILDYEKLYENHKPLGIYFHQFSTATCSKPLRIGSNGQLTRPINIERSLISPSPSGSGFSNTESEIHTLMEAVERYSNMYLDESRLKWSRYKDIQNISINPLDLGLYPEELYERDNFPCSRFSEDSMIPWIKGYDLSSGTSVLVPADFVYYPPVREKPLMLETSNGASAHSGTVQAILNGLYEIIERDSFLTMWLNRIQLPTVKVEKLPFGFTESIKIINEFGMNVKLVNLTNDTLVPTVMAACYNKKPDRYPALLVGTGSHIEPEKAIRKALFEMEFMLIDYVDNPNKTKITRPDQITSIHEHALLYLNPKMRKLWQFMINSQQTRQLPTLAKSLLKNDHTVLRHIVKTLRAKNHRVIWVDITPPDIQSIGLKAVKVFVTGFQPLYYGTKVRFNSDRLRSTAKLHEHGGKTRGRSTELNYAPHPLP